MSHENFPMTQDTAGIWSDMHQGLHAFIAKRIANDAQVDDILQEVFLRVHRQLDRLNDPDRVVAWLYQIARNAIVDYYRSPSRHREHPVGLSRDMELIAPGSLPADDQSGQLRTELAACLRPLLDRISKDYREALTLVEIEGLTQQAAAKRLGLSVSGMKSRVQRGRKQLKQLLDDCCLIRLDRRGGVADYEVRDRGGNPCRKPGMESNGHCSAVGIVLHR
jgi:RNA polymerase sigma-70 factor, ECF subfamily